MRRRSSSAAAMMRERASWSSVDLRRELPGRRSTRAAVPRASRRGGRALQARGSRSAESGPRGAPARAPRRACSRSSQEIQSPSAKGLGSRTAANSMRSPKPKTDTVMREAQDSERKLKQEEREVLPGRRVRQAGREARPPAPAHRVGPVGDSGSRRPRAGRSACARARRASARRTRSPPARECRSA